MPQNDRHFRLAQLDPFVGEWETEATHRLMPGTVVRGVSTFEWLEGGHFMIWRATGDHPDFPSSITILGCEPDVSENAGETGGGCIAHYYDSRGVTRNFLLETEPGVL